MDPNHLEGIEDVDYDPYFFKSIDEYLEELGRRVQKQLDTCPILGGPGCKDRMIGQIMGPRYRGERDARRQAIAVEFNKYAPIYYGSIISLSYFNLTLWLTGSEDAAFMVHDLTDTGITIYGAWRTFRSGETLKLGNTGMMDNLGDVYIGPPVRVTKAPFFPQAGRIWPRGGYRQPPLQLRTGFFNNGPPTRAPRRVGNRGR